MGDFAFGQKAKYLDWLEKIFGKLPGAEKHLVVGNHDGEATQMLPWTSITHLAEVAEGSGRPSVLCHYPMITWQNHNSRNFTASKTEWLARKTAYADRRADN